jgi:C4-dicarboxylate transporter DctQ subunit
LQLPKRTARKQSEWQSVQKVINRLEEWLMAGLLAFMTVLTFIQVVLRYVFNTGLVWSLEATTYSFAALVLIGMSYGVRTKTHIATDLITRKLSDPLRRYVALIAIFACLVYALMMLYGSAILVDRLMTLGNAARDIPAPKWLLTATMPLGFALLVYRFFEAGWSLLRHGEEGDPGDKT